MNTKRFWIILVVLTLSLGLATAALAAAEMSQHASNLFQPQLSMKGQPALEIVKSPFPDKDLPPYLPGLQSHSARQPSGAGDWDGNGVRYPMILQDGGTYRMWFTGNEMYGPGRVGYATSPDGVTWTKHAGNPILDAGNPGDWDADGLEAPFVIRESPTSYKMWYSGFPDCAIGYATSSDGLNWTKYAGNPVLAPGGNTWNNNCVLHPFILYEAGLYKMWLLTQGDDGNGAAPFMAYATSPDGITWTWDAANPLFATDWEIWFWRPDVLHIGGTYHMWYSVWDGADAVTTYATSPNGLTWTKHGSPVLTGTPGTWDEGFAADPFVINDGSMYTLWYDDSTAIGVVTSTNGIDWTKFLNDPILLPGVPSIYMDVNYAHEWVEGWTRAGETVLITLTTGAEVFTASGQADEGGWFGTHQWNWMPYHPNILPGQIVRASAGGTTTEINPIGVINGDVDYDADSVSGTIEAAWFAPETLTVICEVWVENGPPGIEVTGVPADGGAYFCDFGTVGWDLQTTHMVAVRYLEPDGERVINIFEAPWARVNYAHDWVGVNYDIGHTFLLTVTDSGGALKATAQATTISGGGWGGDGFQTEHWNWLPTPPDIQVGDWVRFQSDDGYLNTIQVGEVGGVVDVENDSVSGPIIAPWFNETLTVDCHPWGAPGGTPSRSSTAEPDGSSPYLCQWDPLTEWDILPGQDIAVMYLEPDLDRVINVHRQPAPDVRVEKWAEASGQAMPGGPAIYTIYLRNDGDAPATTISVTDTLPLSTTYLTDTSGVIPALGPGWVAWTLDPLNPGEEVRFQLVLLNTANPGDTLHNIVDISAPDDYSNWNDHAEADVSVVDELPNLYINKHPAPGDPAPGQTMLWEINYGNNGPVASGPVTFTDTLPLSTTVVSWMSENGYNLWTDVSTSGEQLVLTAPTLPGFWGDRILLRIELAPEIAVGTQLTNTVQIATPNDTDPNDNWHVRNDIWTNNPRWNGYVNKDFNWGTLVPGGQADYIIHARNLGNMPFHAWLTDTLPTGGTFAYAMLQVGPYNYPFPPDYVDDEIAYWDLGILEPGEWRNINVHLLIDFAAEPGTDFTNCAEIAHAYTDDSPFDNLDCTTNLLSEPGPNLEIIKTAWWNWEGQLHYDVRLANLGTTTEFSVTLTDTLPLGTDFIGNWWHNWSSNEVQFTDLGDQLVWTINRIEPTWNWYLSFEVDLDGNLIGVPGLAFTNTVEVPLPGDVNPVDNTATVRSVTGPDIYVNKWLSEGLSRPGEIVTFTIEFGNQNNGPWWAGGPTTITDALPAAMTFITATAPWDPNQSWTPAILPGNVLVWGWGDICPTCLWQFDVVVQITDTVQAWDVLPNTVEMFSANPNDLEWDYGNNTSTAFVTILDPQFAISKAYESTGIAGTPVTYTLLISNTGGWADTGILVHDLLPEYVAYTVGGDYDPLTGLIEWQITSLLPGASAEVTFSGNLACTPDVSVVNDTYQVAGSDEGVTSPPGAPVSFVIAAPTLVADIGLSATSIFLGESVTFTSLSTTNGTPIVNWAWDFGDGNTATGSVVSHVYGVPGVFPVTLTVTDACGFTETLVVAQAITVVQTSFEIFLPVTSKQ